MKRKKSPYSADHHSHPVDSYWTPDALAEIEATYPEGITTQQIVDIFLSRGEKFTEATFRKYVQLGLLPRSVRVGRKGKHRGSKGLYPVSIIRQIDVIRRLMIQGLTIEEIQREFPFLGGDIDELSRQLKRVFSGIEQATSVDDNTLGGDQVVLRALADARLVAEDLLTKLRAIERRLLMRARMARAAV